jgi:hypothetical protein
LSFSVEINRAAPRLRQSRKALGFGYGLNEKQKTKNKNISAPG